MLILTYIFYFLMVALLVSGCVKASMSIRYRKLEMQYGPLFKDLIHRHVYLNSDLYQMRVPYIDLPLDEFRKHNLDDRNVRKILVNIIMGCRDQFPGEKKRLLKKLYKDLDLELYTIIELQLVEGEQLVASLNELMAMEVELDSSRIKPFLKSKNSSIRLLSRQYLKSMKGYRRDFSLEEYEESDSTALA